MIGTLLIRSDACTQIGTGHLMRCLALAESWQDAGGCATFVMATDTPAFKARLEVERVRVLPLTTEAGSLDDARQTIRIARELGAKWVVVDGYHFTDGYQLAIKEAKLSLLFIDDNGHANHYYADVVLNQNLHANERLYAKCEPYTRLLLGTRYALLRREFSKWRGWKRETSDVARNILVTLGGADPDNVTLKVVQTLQEIDIPKIMVKIIVGPSNPHKKSLEDAILSAPCYMGILDNATNMPELMGWADLAVSGGGTTSWELAFMGLPSVVLVMAENQRLIAEELDKMGVVSNLGWHERVLPSQVEQAVTRLLLSAKVRKRMASRGQGLVDGDGVARVLMRVRGQRIRLRRAREEDRRLIWEWSNDPSVRAVSFSSEPILWEQHLKWFESKLNDPGCFFYIALDEEDTPVGQVRYDTKDGEVMVSISLGPNFCGRRYGNEVIELSSQKLFKASDAKSIHSYVKMGNEASIKVFLEAGFKKLGMEMMHGEQAVHLILPKKGAV